MAIVSKIFDDITKLAVMLNAGIDVDGVSGFHAFEARDVVNGLRGQSGTSVFYNAAVAGGSNATKALTSSVVINVTANSTGGAAVTKIVFCHYEDPSVFDIYTITISPAEEFTFAGTITITTATITLSGTMT